MGEQTWSFPIAPDSSLRTPTRLVRPRVSERPLSSYARTGGRSGGLAATPRRVYDHPESQILPPCDSCEKRSGATRSLLDDLPERPDASEEVPELGTTGRGLGQGRSRNIRDAREKRACREWPVSTAERGPHGPALAARPCG
jgi:hypothetical protein